MIDFLSAAQLAVINALKAGVAPALARVFDVVPQGIEPNFVKLGEIALEQLGTKDEPRVRIELEVHSIYRGKDRGVLLQMMHAAHESLDGQPIAAAGIDFTWPELLAAAASDAGPDGVTYAGISTFEFFAEPA